METVPDYDVLLLFFTSGRDKSISSTMYSIIFQNKASGYMLHYQRILIPG